MDQTFSGQSSGIKIVQHCKLWKVILLVLSWPKDKTNWIIFFVTCGDDKQVYFVAFLHFLSKHKSFSTSHEYLFDRTVSQKLYRASIFKGAFNIYVDRILTFFDHVLPLVNKDYKERVCLPYERIHLTSLLPMYLPLHVYVHTEWPLNKVKWLKLLIFFRMLMLSYLLLIDCTQWYETHKAKSFYSICIKHIPEKNQTIKRPLMDFNFFISSFSFANFIGVKCFFKNSFFHRYQNWYGEVWRAWKEHLYIREGKFLCLRLPLILD